MAQQPRNQPMTPSAFFSDGQSARPLVEGTVSRTGQVVGAYTVDRQAGYEWGGKFPPAFPRGGDALREKLERGREQYTIYCAVCHGDLGDGQGMIVRRGFTRPPAFYPVAADAADKSLYQRELDFMDPTKKPPGYIYNVMTNAFGAMYSYAARVKPEDRWAIAAYIGALQLSQHADEAALPPADRKKVEEAKANPAQPTRNQP
jgi:mono/diheme cytochrome c family protein